MSLQSIREKFAKIFAKLIEPRKRLNCSKLLKKKLDERYKTYNLYLKNSKDFCKINRAEKTIELLLQIIIAVKVKNLMIGWNCRKKKIS